MLRFCLFRDYLLLACLFKTHAAVPLQKDSQLQELLIGITLYCSSSALEKLPALRGSAM